MSFTVERALQRIQADHTGEHLPMEKFLEAIHDSEYAGDPFFRMPSTLPPYRMPQLEGSAFVRPYYPGEYDEF